MILDRIVDYKRKKLEEEKRNIPINRLFSQIEACEETRDFKKSIVENQDISIIAEVKKASPSKGIIREDFHPLAIGKEYEKNKVQAISVLTEDKFFQGRDEYLPQIKAITSVPILRKDFIIDPYQIYQGRVLGADAILLIAAILTKKELSAFQSIAKDLGLQCLVEVHNEEELNVVLEGEAEIIGINNRNLKTFKTTLETTERLMSLIPKDKIVISESGINTRKDMHLLGNLGVQGVLIGESLMRAEAIDEKLRELRGR